jgi:hypothetical protein
VFGDEKDKSRTNMFIEMLQRHQVKVYSLKSDVSADGKNFKAGQAYVIPTAQQQFKIIKTVFEKTFEYKDSLFYDVTSWTMSLAFGLPNAEIKTPTTNLLGDELTATPVAEGKLIGGVSSNAYIFRWDDYYAPKLLYRLQSKGLITKVATQKFGAGINGKQEAFGYGSIVIPVKIQNRSEAEIFQILNDAIKGTGVEVYSTGSSLSVSGIDLGSNSMVNIRAPRVMMFGGTGTSATDVGEIWHLMDQRFGIPVSIVDVDRFNAINTARYNVIIMPSGSYSNLDKNAQDKLRTWIAGGGTLIATEDATNWLAKNGMTKVIFRDAADKKDSTAMLPYYLRSDEQRAKDMAGSLFEAKLDPTHPLCYGYNQNTVTVFKSNTLFMDQNNDPYDSPVMYTDNPLQSGYLYRGYRDKVKNTAVVNIDQVGRGRVVSMVDNLNFRAFWLGTSKIFMNAVVFGEIIRL